MGLRIIAITQRSAAVRIAANGSVDRAARFGGLPTANSSYASLPATEGGVAVLPNGTVALAGSVAPTLSSSLLPTEHYDLPFVAAPAAALPSTVRDALPSASCSGSACSGSAGLLATLAPDASAPGLALSIDDLPNLTLRNLGTAAASNLQITATGYTVNSNCGTSLAPAGECSLSLSGSGPGSMTLSASNAPAFTTALLSTTLIANSIAVLPRELLRSADRGLRSFHAHADGDEPQFGNADVRIEKYKHHQNGLHRRGDGKHLHTCRRWCLEGAWTGRHMHHHAWPVRKR